MRKSQGQRDHLLGEAQAIEAFHVQIAHHHVEVLDGQSFGAEALELLRSGELPPRCLVLLDVHMPRMDGLEFLRTIRADPVLNSLVVVMLSTSDKTEDKAEALSLNVAGYLLKSMSFPKFVNQLTVIDQYWSMMQVP